jgi:hypothetical protein
MALPIKLTRKPMLVDLHQMIDAASGPTCQTVEVDPASFHRTQRPAAIAFDSAMTDAVCPTIQVPLCHFLSFVSLS